MFPSRCLDGLVWRFPSVPESRFASPKSVPKGTFCQKAACPERAASLRVVGIGVLGSADGCLGGPSLFLRIAFRHRGPASARQRLAGCSLGEDDSNSPSLRGKAEPQSSER